MLRALRVLAATIGLQRITNFLPCYFAVASSLTMMRPFLDDLSAFAFSISDGGHALFNAPFQWVCLANGDADFQDNVIFFGFDARAADPVLVAKVPRLVKNGWMLKTEHDHLVDLWDCMGNTAVDYVPRTLWIHFDTGSIRLDDLLRSGRKPDASQPASRSGRTSPGDSIGKAGCTHAARSQWDDCASSAAFC